MAISAAQVKELREKTGLGMMLCKKALEESGGDMDKAIEDLRKQGQATAAKRAGRSAKEGIVTLRVEDTCALMYELNCETDFVAKNKDFIAFNQALGTILLENRPADQASALALSAEALGGMTVEEKVLDLMGKIGEKISFRRFVIESSDPSSEKIFSYVHNNGKIGVLVKLHADNAEHLASAEARALGKDLAMQVAASSPLAIDSDSLPRDLVAKEREIYLDQVKNSGKPEKIWDKIVEGKLNKYFSEVTLLKQPFIKETDKNVTDRINEAAKAVGTTPQVRWFCRFEVGGQE